MLLRSFILELLLLEYRVGPIAMSVVWRGSIDDQEICYGDERVVSWSALAYCDERGKARY